MVNPLGASTLLELTSSIRSGKGMTDAEPNVFRLAQDYESSALRWGEIESPRPKNKLFDHLTDVGRTLSETTSGQARLVDLLDNPSRSVRLLAGTCCLTFAPNLAEPVLREIADGPGLDAITAKYTLIEFHKGNLKF